jgi:hypothetical protein
MVISRMTNRRNSPLARCVTLFKEEVKDIVHILAELPKYRIETTSGIHVHLDNRKVELFVCLYFLKLHLSWESFLESTFTRYICGYSSPSGMLPALLISRQPSISDALSNILQGKKYLSWAPSETISRSKKYMNNGEPYVSAISLAKNDLENLYIIRNRIAHSSQFARDNFRDLVRQEIGYNPKGMTPGRFLLAKKRLGRKKISYIQYYLDNLEILSNLIVP